MRNFIFFIFLSLSVILGGCTEHRKYKKTVFVLEDLMGKSINFFNNNVYHVNTKDTVLYEQETYQYTIVVYAHPSDCESCVWKFDEWYLKRKELMYYNENVDFKFIIQSQNYDNIGHYIVHALPDIPVIYDSSGVFIEKNNLPKEHKYHTFLLDNNKKIVLVGSPIANDKLWNMYKEIIKK
jgi:hypothetical protein